MLRLRPVGFALCKKGGDAFFGVAPQHVFGHDGGGLGIGGLQRQADLILKGAFADLDGGG